jgi:hypothetical protein
MVFTLALVDQVLFSIKDVTLDFETQHLVIVFARISVNLIMCMVAVSLVGQHVMRVSEMFRGARQMAARVR